MLSLCLRAHLGGVCVSAPPQVALGAPPRGGLARVDLGRKAQRAHRLLCAGTATTQGWLLPLDPERVPRGSSNQGQHRMLKHGLTGSEHTVSCAPAPPPPAQGRVGHHTKGWMFSSLPGSFATWWEPRHVGMHSLSLSSRCAPVSAGLCWTACGQLPGSRAWVATCRLLSSAALLRMRVRSRGRLPRARTGRRGAQLCP